MNTVWIVLPILLVLMFHLGIELDLRSFARVLLHPKAVFAGLVGQLVLLPAIAFGVGLAFRLPPVCFMGLMLVACCPGGSSSNVFTMLAKGDVPLSVTLTALSSLVTLITLPPRHGGHGPLRGDARRHGGPPPQSGKLIVQNIVLLFLPMALGAAFRRWRPQAAGRVQRILGRAAFPALMFLAALFFIQYADTIGSYIGLLGPATAALILLAMGGGMLLARVFRLDRAVRRTLVIEVGMQNAAQAIAVAASPLVFADGEMAVPAIVYALLMNVILLLYLKLLRPSAAKTR